MSAGFRRHLVGKTHRNVCYSATTITALSVGYWSYGHFVKQLVEFYLNNIVNLHPLTPYIMRSYAHKMANVLWPQILWRQFTQCVVELVASLNYQLPKATLRVRSVRILQQINGQPLRYSSRFKSRWCQFLRHFTYSTCRHAYLCLRFKLF